MSVNKSVVGIGIGINAFHSSDRRTKRRKNAWLLSLERNWVANYKLRSRSDNVDFSNRKWLMFCRCFFVAIVVVVVAIGLLDCWISVCIFCHPKNTKNWITGWDELKTDESNVVYEQRKKKLTPASRQMPNRKFAAIFRCVPSQIQLKIPLVGVDVKNTSSQYTKCMQCNQTHTLLTV